jgi:hypothetical protein
MRVAGPPSKVSDVSFGLQSSRDVDFGCLKTAGSRQISKLTQHFLKRELRLKSQQNTQSGCCAPLGQAVLKLSCHVREDASTRITPSRQQKSPPSSLGA